jgi:hypothetical protein
MGNPLDPTLMTAQERLAEIGRILALGLMRLQAQQSSEFFAEARDSSLAFPAPKSGPARRPRNQGGEA